MKRCSIISVIVLFCLNFGCFPAEMLQYRAFDENNVQQFEPMIHIDTGASDLLFHISEKSSKTCTEEEKQKTKETVDLFFEELLRFNYALQKPAWEDISTLSEDLKDAVRFQEKYNLINEYITEHGADLNVTSLIETSLISFDGNDGVIVRTTGVLNYRFISMDGVCPAFLSNLSLGDNPIAFAIYVQIPSDNKSTAKVIGWSFKRYNGIQDNYYSEVLR